MQNAEKLWIRCVQQKCFGGEIYLLKKGRNLNEESKLLKLCPYLDTNALLRVKGRLENTSISIDAASPLILPPKHSYTQLLIKHFHEQALHCGQETVLNQLRQKYWILDGRAAVRAAWSRCSICRLNRAKPVQPQMGPLPACRLGIRERPFTYTGVDYFGPMTVSNKRRQEKRYGVVFTCLTTRAIHLELATSLTTDACMMATQRFTGRRGRPKEMYSDNGTNFRGASSELAAAFKEMNKADLCEKLAMKEILWKFSPPSSPYFGGCWERLIRSVKTSLRAILHEHSPKEETLLTFLIEVEAVLNSRPLTHVPLDHEDDVVLNPNCFLLGSNSVTCGAANLTSVVSQGNLRKQWKVAQQMADRFWTRWVREYAPTLTKRTKWFKLASPLVVGKLVLLVDESLPRGCWLRGKITAIHPGKDGQVRVVDVLTMFGTYRRGVNKLAVLDLNEGEVYYSPFQKKGQ